MSEQPLNVAIIGLGTVGSGVAKILLEQPKRIARRAGRPIQLRKAVVRDLKKPRGITLPPGVLTTSVQEVIDDDSIDLAIHLVGGVDPAYDIMRGLLNSGKDVVTANKALLCERGPELFRQARELDRCIAFEAAVAGGIPIIATVGQSMSANQIISLEAILNGTSNFILSQMLSENWSYDAALKKAQELGYAEADPTMDVDGTDAAQKLVILAQLAFGTRVQVGDFLRNGIDTLELADLHFARELGYTVKLLAVAKLIKGQLEMHVQPSLVHRDRPLAKVEGPFNIIALEGDAVGKTWYSGPGAGQMATASAVMADVIDMAVGRAQLTFNRLDLWEDGPGLPLQPVEEMTRRYYLRFNVIDRPHVIADITDVLGRQEISIASVIQHEAPEPEENCTTVPLVIMTHRTTEGKLRAADAELSRLNAIEPPYIRMPVAD